MGHQTRPNVELDACVDYLTPMSERGGGGRSGRPPPPAADESESDDAYFLRWMENSDYAEWLDAAIENLPGRLTRYTCVHLPRAHAL